MLKLVDWLEFMACADRFGNFRQKDSGALIFSSAGTLNRWTRIQMACSPVRLNVLNVVGNLRLVDWLEVYGLCNGLGNFRQKDSGALIFSSAGTLNRRKSIQMACSPVRVMSRSIHSGLCRSAQELSAKRSLHGLAGGSWVE